MSEYTGVQCPYCHKIFDENDDIAVCPVCGTPHHRACYKEHLQCANDARHESGFVWQSSGVVTVAKPVSGSVTCESCGTANPVENAVCSACGRPLRKKSFTVRSAGPASSDTAPTSANSDRPNTDAPFLGAQFDTSELYSDSDEIDGIPVKDWKAYISTSIPYYLYNFKLQDRLKRKIAFTWSAAVFPMFYFLYRRMWGFAALSSLLRFLCNLPGAVQYLAYNGISFGISASLLDTAATVGSGLNLAFNVVWGLFAVWFYRRHGARVMKSVRSSSATSEDFARRLKGVSGPSYIALIVVLGVILLSTAYLFAMSGAVGGLTSGLTSGLSEFSGVSL